MTRNSQPRHFFSWIIPFTFRSDFTDVDLVRGTVRNFQT